MWSNSSNDFVAFVRIAMAMTGRAIVIVVVSVKTIGLAATRVATMRARGAKLFLFMCWLESRSTGRVANLSSSAE